MRTTSKSPDVLPCPCCGTEPIVHDRCGIFDYGVFIECPACGLRTSEAAYYTEEGFPEVLKARPDMDRPHVFFLVASAWNLRTCHAAPPKRRYPRPHYIPVHQQRSLTQ